MTRKRRRELLDLGPLGKDSEFGYGRIDACFAVEGGCQSIYPLSGFIVGPSEVRPHQTCTWQLQSVSGGRPPLTFEWSGALSGNQMWVTGSVTQSGWLIATVESEDGQQHSDQIWVTVDSNAPDCPE